MTTWPIASLTLLVINLFVWGSGLIFYWNGAEEFGGGKVGKYDFQRQDDYALFGINDRLALYVDKNESPSVRVYIPGDPTLRWCCGGDFEADFGRQAILLPPLYVKGGILFSGALSDDGSYAVNTRTGKIHKASPADKAGLGGDDGLFASKGLYSAIGIDPTADLQTPVTLGYATRHHQALNVINPSCAGFSGPAMMFSFFLLLAAAVEFIIRILIRRTRKRLAKGR